jgi:phytol kinase
MGPLLGVIATVFLLISVSEILWRYKGMHPEYTRKFVHITVGSLVAFLPLFLSRAEIVGLSAAFVVVVGAGHYLNIFRAIRSVQRPTWGEAFFAIAVGVLAYVAPHGWVYMAALLHMSLADGLAAVIGTKFGKTTSYYVFGYQKSVVGTLTFLVVSAGIFVTYALCSGTGFSVWFIPVALGATVLENIAVRGLDNLFVPLFVAISLNLLR